jgi:HSP20 family molecular chaperone IbpA
MLGLRDMPLIALSRRRIAATDITEGQGCFHIQMDPPGIDMSTLDVNISNGKGERKRPHQGDDLPGNRLRERPYGLIQRIILIPLEAKIDSADAKFGNGVLMITLPKSDGYSRAMEPVPENFSSRKSAPGLQTSFPRFAQIQE